MKTLLAFILSLACTTYTWSATYYMRADGTVLAADKANATSCGSADTALSVAQHNAATFSAGDTIYLCSDGGDFTAIIIPPSSGSPGSPITYTPAPGQTVTVDATAKTRAFYINGKNDISIVGTNLIVKNSTTANIGTAGVTDRLVVDQVTSEGGTGSGIYILAGDDVRVTNCKINQPAQLGLAFVVSGSDTVVNGVATNNAFIGTAGGTYTAGIYLRGATINFSYNTISNWTLSATTTPLISGVSLTGLSATNNIISACTGRGFYFDSNSSGASIVGGMITNSTGAAVWNIGGGLTVNGTEMLNCGVNGFVSTAGSSTLTNCAVHNNTGAGLNISSGASVIIGGCNVYSNTTYGVSMATGSTGNLTITDTDVYDNGSSGIQLATSGSVAISSVNSYGNTTTAAGANAVLEGAGVYTVTQCAFYNAIGAGDTATASDGVKVQGTATATFVECIAYDNTDDGFQANEASTSTYTRCTSYDNGCADAGAGDGWTAHATATLYMDYCVAFKNWKSGVAVTETSSGSIRNCSFYDNYNEGNDPGGDPWYNNQGIGIKSPAAWTVLNNATANNGTEIVITAEAMNGRTAGSLNIDSNLYYDSRGGNGFWFNGSALTWANWLTAIAADAGVIGEDANSLNADPEWIDAANGNLRLKPVSPCINGGTDLGLYWDCDHHHIYNRPDMGAYEYQNIGGRRKLP